MWSQFVLCFLVGLSIASSDNPSWKENTEYTYEVHGRSLAGLHRISNRFSGIVLRAKFVVQPQSDDRLRCKILHPEYAEVQANLPEGWMSKIPDSQLNYQPLVMTDKPFEVAMRNGVVGDLIVEKEVEEWEANIMKSFVSQLQMDTRGENLLQSEMNVLPKEGSNNAVFKTLEDTVTGITETTYDIHPLPEYILQSEPHLAPFPHLKGDGSIIEIVKSKNFTEGHDLPSYYFGLGNAGEWKPQSNQFGQMLQRESLCRAVVTGTLQRYTIQFSETINRIIVSLTREDQQEGSVNSMMRVKLANADQQKTQLPELVSPVSLGRLVYAYGKQEPGNNKVSRGTIYQRDQYQKYSDESSEEYSNHLQKRHPRSLVHQNIRESMESSIESQEDWTLYKPKLNEAPRSAMLPLTTGYKGLSIKHAPNMQIVEKVCSIAQKIGQELEETHEITKKHTLSQFVVLTSVLRIMNEQELKQVAERLYTQETEGTKFYTWIVFRDSLAGTGTGPAFLMIKEWIENKKLPENEAANIIITMGEAVRQPTEEYIRAFFELVKRQMKSDQNDQFMLNETMLFTLSRLINRVYVDKHVSHREYPTHTFGSFATKPGRAFVRNEVIPYLTKQLREAVANGEDKKVHAWIRSLGLIGSTEIIYTFEPYLEGKVQCSQFQRFLMVLALRNVARIEPKLVGTILYRMYQNVGETTEIRVASVYMLMHTSPSPDMLQRMAMYTHIEANHKVCAAVKSAIENISELKGLEFAKLRSAAHSAKPFLTRKNFGVQDSLDMLVSYASTNWESYYKNVLQTIVGEKSGIPTSFYYAIEGKQNGYQYKLFSVESVISDIRNLYHVLERQTEWYKQKQTKQQASQESEKSLWGSHNIARLLNLQTEEFEQLEGGMFLQIGDWRKHLIYNNHSLERLPQMLEEIERILENGWRVSYTKLINNRDSAIAYPTEIGIPFLYTNDLPIMMKVEGSVKGRAQPKISSGNKLNIPDIVEMEGELKVTFSGRQHTEFGLFTPFNHQQYSAGYDQNVHVHLPIRAKINVDLRNRNVQYEVEPLENEKNVRIFHKSSWPFVSKRNILDLQNRLENKNIHIVRRSTQNQWERIFGDKTVGMAFRVKYENDDKNPSINSLIRGDIFESNIQYEQFDVEYVPEQSQNKKLKVNFAYQKKQQREYQEENNETNRKTMLNKLSQLPKQNNQRVSELAKQASIGIHEATVYVVDSRAEFSGKQNVELIGSIAYAESQVGFKSRMLAYFNKQSQISGSKPFEGAMTAKFNMARVNGLNMEYVMKSDLASNVEIDVAYDEKLPTNNQIEINAQLRRSESRKEYLQKQPTFEKCQREMQQGNNQLLACANMTQLLGLLDRIKVQINYPNMRPKYLDTLLNAYNSMNYYDHQNFEIEHNREPKQKQGEITVNVRFHPDLQRVNISFANQETYAFINNKQVNPWVRRVVVVHPVFDAIDRLEGKMTGRQTYKPICSMDKTEAYTFDGAEYPLALKKFWTVLLQYVPLRSSGHSQSSVEKQLKSELENYVILARQSIQNSEQKEIQIIVSTPQTEGKVLEVLMKPKNGGNYPQVSVDGKQITFTESDKSTTYQEQVTVAGLPNGEVYVKVHDAFHVIYDGTRVKITALTLKMRNRLRGICGNYNGQDSDDFTSPNDCVAREAKQFIATYTVLKDGESNQEIMDLKSQKNHCVHKKTPLYVNYISEKNDRNQNEATSSCSKYQTRYILENGQLCFSVKPLTVCKYGCRQQGSNFKNIEVHCVENKNVANLWKSQIDKGASPDFSQKPVTKSVQMEVPQGCRSM